jgi:pimeloyl-ACP methyl ester carboxylesterase
VFVVGGAVTAKRTAITTRRVLSPDGVAISVTISGAGPNVLLVHGSAVIGASWAYVAKQLATDHAVHVMDRRGGGSSGDTDGPYSIELEVHDVAAVIESIDAGTNANVHLVGHSYGGLICLLAAARVAAIAALTVYEPTLFTPGHSSGWTSERLGRYDELVAAGDRDAAAVLFMTEVVGGPAELDLARSVPTVWQTMGELAARTGREARQVQAAKVDRSALATLPIPTQVVYGERSPTWLIEASRATAALIPAARLIPMTGHGHLAAATAPDQLAEIISSLQA